MVEDIDKYTQHFFNLSQTLHFYLTKIDILKKKMHMEELIYQFSLNKNVIST